MAQWCSLHQSRYCPCYGYPSLTQHGDHQQVYTMRTENGFYSEEHHGDGTWTIIRKGEVPIRYCSCGDEPFACHVYMDRKCLHSYVPRVTPNTPMSSAGPMPALPMPVPENVCLDCGTNCWPHAPQAEGYPCDPVKIKQEREWAKQREAKKAQQDLDQIYLDTYAGSKHTTPKYLDGWHTWREEWLRTGATYALDRMKMYPVPPTAPENISAEVEKKKHGLISKKAALVGIGIIVVFWILLGIMMGMGL